MSIFTRHGVNHSKRSDVGVLNRNIASRKKLELILQIVVRISQCNLKHKNYIMQVYTLKLSNAASNII